MRSTLEQLVNAVLYEGYILYPYRASSKKNQRERFTFGRVYPQAFSEKENGAEACAMQTECLFQISGEQTRLNVTFGFLQPVMRTIGMMESVPSRDAETEHIQFQGIPRPVQPWMESVERKVSIIVRDFPESANISFIFPPTESQEEIKDENGEIACVVMRRHECLEGQIEARFTKLQKDLLKICVRVVNRSAIEPAALHVPQQVLLRTFASSHFTLELENGQFLSLLETPPEFKAYAQECENIGCWPVLVGDKSVNERGTMLASPILLYDYPEIAPESAGEFFDGTEIDEMLALRVLTLSDEEKREMRMEEFPRKILERTSALTANDFLKLHGVLREPRVLSEEFFNPGEPMQKVTAAVTRLKPGDRVVIRPKRRADALDLILSGKIAIIEAIEQDLEGQFHVAVVLENDPGHDLGVARQPGHRFFYGVDEVDPLKPEARA